MFKKLKDKIAEEVKSSPQRLQQLTQSVTERLQNVSNEENFFTLADDDMAASNTSLDASFTDVSLRSPTPADSRASRRLSNSSMASDVSFLPQYEPSANLYHMQSDLDVSASEVEDNASMSSQLGHHISKEQVYAAFQKAQMRYHKYRGRYTDILNHYKILEKENAKIKVVLVETQDKAIRRVSELREQCLLEQKAKAHLENALRVELDERQIKIDTLETKIKLLKNGAVTAADDSLVDAGPLVSDAAKSAENLEVLTKHLNDARIDIEKLNANIQELKANAIIFNTKEGEYRHRIRDLEKSLQDKTAEYNQVCEKEKDCSLKLAQIKMDLHSELHDRDVEISKLKEDMVVLEKSKAKESGGMKMENLQSQNVKMIEKVEVLSQKCQKYESELIQLEKCKIENANLNEIVTNLKKENEEIAGEKLQVDEKLKLKLEELDRTMGEFSKLQSAHEEMILEKSNLNVIITNLKKINEEIIEKKQDVADDLKKYENLKIDYDMKVEELGKIKSEFLEIQFVHEKACEELQNYHTILNNNEKLQSELSQLEAMMQHNDRILKENEKLKTELEHLKGQLIKLEDSLGEKEALAVRIQEVEKQCEAQKFEHEEKVKKVREGARTSLLSLEAKVKEKVMCEFEDRETRLKEDFQQKLQQLTSNSEDDVKVTEIKLMESEDKIKILQKLIETSKSELKNDKAKYLALENSHLDLISENSNTRNELAKLRKDITDNTASNINEVALLQREILRQRQDFTKLQEDSAKLEEEIMTLKTENQSLTDAITQSWNEPAVEEVDNVGRLQKETAELQNEISKLEQELSTRTGECSVLRNEIALLQEVSSQQQNDNCKLQETIRCFAEKAQEYSKMNYKLTHQLQEKEEETAKFIGEASEMKAEIKNLLLKCSVIDTELANYNVTKESLTNSIKEKTEEIDKLKSELENNATMAEKITEYEEKFNTLQLQLQEKQNSINAQKEVMTCMRDEIQTASDHEYQLEQELDRIKDDIQQQTNENAQLRLIITEKETELNAIKEKLERVAFSKTEAEGKLTALELQQCDTFAALDNAEHLVGRLRKERDTISAESEEQAALLKTVQDYEKELTLENVSLKNELEKIEKEKVVLTDTVEILKEYESKYQNLLDENHNLKEQISQIEELRFKVNTVQSENETILSVNKRIREEVIQYESKCQNLLDENYNLKEQIDKIQFTLTAVQNENESNSLANKRLHEQLTVLGAAQNDLELAEQDKQKLVEEITELQSQINVRMQENQFLKEKLSKLQNVEMKHNDLLAENESIRAKHLQVSEEVAELRNRNQQLSSDYKQLLDENEKNVREFEGFKIQCENVEHNLPNFEEMQSQLLAENQSLSNKLLETELALAAAVNERHKLERLRDSSLDHTENQAASLKNHIAETEEVKTKYEALYSENKTMKTEKNNLMQLCDKMCADKKALQSQLEELERQYSEIIHERQLLKDEIQELKISPINYNSKAKLETDGLQPDKDVREKYIKEVESLRDKLEQYKSIDKTNRTSIEFYENELQKVNVKNEKLTRKLDETLVTLPTLRNDGHELGDAAAVLEYLRNVLFNYMTGKESLVLAKVIAAVCKFDRQQTDLIIQREQQKQTLLGHLFGS